MGLPGSHRVQWAALPSRVRAEIEAAVGGKVAQAEGQQGGYGPGMAARCVLEDGRRVFVKAVPASEFPDSIRMLEAEVGNNKLLPAAVRAPGVLQVIDQDGWAVVIFDDIEGRQPGLPWTHEDLRRVGQAVQSLNALPAHPALPTLADRDEKELRGWQVLVEQDPSLIPDAWCRRHVSRLAELEAHWIDVAAGENLVHGDVRSDNLIISEAGEVFFVDWTSASRGNGLFDLLAMLPSIELAGGGEPEHALAVMEAHVESEVAAPLVAALAGYFVQRGGLPDLPGLPTVRAFQRGQGRVACSWLRRLTGWD